MTTPLPVIANVFRTAFEWSHSSGQTAVNVIHIQTAAGPKTPLQVYTAINAHVTAAMWDQLSSAASVSTVAITPLDGVSSTTSFTTGNPAKWTGGAGGIIAPQVAVMMKIQTGFRGRNKRGRIYLPFIVGAAVDNGFLNPSEATTMTAAWEAFNAALLVDATTPCEIGVAAYDRRHAGAGAGWTPASNLLVESPLGTQRRRQQRNR